MSFLLPDTAYAMGSQGGDPSQTLMGLMPLVLMFVIFYFLLIRPQQKRAKEHKTMIENLKRGDEVVIQGGVHGKITKVRDETFELEVAQNVRVEVDKPAVARLKRSGE